MASAVSDEKKKLNKIFGVGWISLKSMRVKKVWKDWNLISFDF